MRVLQSLNNATPGLCYYTLASGEQCASSVNSMTLQQMYYGPTLDAFAEPQRICIYSGSTLCPAASPSPSAPSPVAAAPPSPSTPSPVAAAPSPSAPSPSLAWSATVGGNNVVTVVNVQGIDAFAVDVTQFLTTPAAGVTVALTRTTYNNNCSVSGSTVSGAAQNRSLQYYVPFVVTAQAGGATLDGQLSVVETPAVCSTNTVTTVQRSAPTMCTSGGSTVGQLNNVGSVPCTVGGQPVVQLYGMSSSTFFPDPTAMYIWSSSDTSNTATLYNFNATVVLGADTTVTVTFFADDCCDLFINCVYIGPGNLFNNGAYVTTSMTSNTYKGVALKKGCNVFQCIAKNMGGVAGLAFAAVDESTQAVVLHSDLSWNWTAMVEP